MKHLIIYISIIFLSITALSAQDSKQLYNHQAGFSAGTFFGLAPTYRYTSGDHGFQVSALPVFTDGDLAFNGSVGYIRKIARAEYIDLSFASSLSFGFLTGRQVTALNFGPQAEVKLTKSLTLETRVGYMFARNNHPNKEFTTLVATPGGGISLLYNFTK